MKRRISIAVIALLACASPLRAEPSGGLDWSAWQRMPVLQDGRIMPLDSFARAKVKTICGDVRPSLGKLGALTNAEMSALSADEIKRLASEGKPRRFLAAELLYSWTVEPEKWDDVPFLLAEDETLRTEVLGVPLAGEDGSRLRYVSPRQIRLSKKFDQIRGEIETILMEAQEKQKRPELSFLQEKVRNLDDAQELFFQLSYDPGRPGRSEDENRWLAIDFVRMRNSWDRFVETLTQHAALIEPPSNLRSGAGNDQAAKTLQELYQLADKTDQAMREFAAQWGPVQSGKKPLESIEPAAAKVRKLMGQLDATVREIAESDLPDPARLIKDDTASIQSDRQNLCRRTMNLVLQAIQVHWEIYSAGGESINIVPALEASAFEPDRYRSEIRPWISLHALLRGTPSLLNGYPSQDVQDLRSAWDDARTAYFNRRDAQGPSQFAQSMGRFTAKVRALAEKIEPDRQQLPLVERDRGLLAKTAYPVAFATDAEVVYNRIDPFFWSGCASLAAAGILGLSLVTLRKPLFWIGIATMVVGVALIVGGFAVRMYITRWAPVTSMFETIVWVTMCVSLLTLWVTFLPLLGPTSKAAWKLTALPGSLEERDSAAKRNRASADSGPPETSQVGIRTAALGLRLALFLGGLFIGCSYMGVFEPDSAGSGFSVHLAAILPHADLGSSMPNLSASMVWAASMFVAVMFVWYLPRIVPSALFAIPMSLALAGREEGAERMEKIYRWRVVTMAGAVASFVAALFAMYAPFPKDIQALMPVLRSNFWLGIHVLTIVTSYAAVAVAWVIGNVALGFFAFGRYRTIASRRASELELVGDPAAAGTRASADETTLDTVIVAENERPDEVITVDVLDDAKRGPPAFCGTLAWLNYRVLQVAVLLLAAGTILGGLWADVSWGRFWGWDPKEVGALIALLVIMTALHGRRAGWPGDLSLAIGSVLGFFGVIWAWNVVNFILNAGKHSYGAGEGGQWMWVAAMAGIQLLFVGTAIARVMIETGDSASAAS